MSVYCHDCGSKLVEQAKFCSACGIKVVGLHDGAQLGAVPELGEGATSVADDSLEPVSGDGEFSRNETANTWVSVVVGLDESPLKPGTPQDWIPGNPGNGRRQRPFRGELISLGDIDTWSKLGQPELLTDGLTVRRNPDSAQIVWVEVVGHRDDDLWRIREETGFDPASLGSLTLNPLMNNWVWMWPARSVWDGFPFRARS